MSMIEVDDIVESLDEGRAPSAELLEGISRINAAVARFYRKRAAQRGVPGYPRLEARPRVLDNAPSKREVFEDLLQHHSVVGVHVNLINGGAVYPSFLKGVGVRFDLGLNMPVPIPDLEIDDMGISCTLSFRGAGHYCVFPWQSVFAFSWDGGSVGWTEDMPPTGPRAA